ncbi:hypothetical protein UlMin_042517 [Ulmus minor]
MSRKNSYNGLVTQLTVLLFSPQFIGSRSPKGVRYLLYTAGSIGILIFIGICARFYCSPLGNQRLLAANRETLSGRIIIDQNSASIVSMGLDDTIIGSYPKTLIGESCRLPNPTANTCSICLSEYKAKEALRTIPDCGHYFHDDCIVEWLKLNATCPLCRNMPPRAVSR